MTAAIDCLRRELRALAAILKDNKDEVSSVTNGHRSAVFTDTSSLHQEAFEIQQALDLLEAHEPSRD